jgi:large subunit ribosomal protein L9
MATAEVLLLEPVQHLGGEGACVRVRAGYARNYLVPRKLALAFSATNQRQIAALVRRREERELRRRGEAEEKGKLFSGLRIVIRVRTGENGKLFGSVTAMDLLAELANQSVAIERDQLLLEHPIKELGQHEVEVKLHPDVRARFTVEIVSENPVLTTQ